MPTNVHARGHAIHKTLALKNECFGCGKDNPGGMKLRFTFDAHQHAVCNFKLAKRYQGPPGHAHGGVIATILDEAMGKINKLHSVIALTKSMTVEYMRPVPLGVRLTAVGRELSVHGRKHQNVAEIRDAEGQVLARGEALFIAVDAAKMFEKFVDRKAIVAQRNGKKA